MPQRRSTRVSSRHDLETQKKNLTPRNTHKRQLSSNSTVMASSSTSHTRKRPKAGTTTGGSKSTPKKSRYFKESDIEQEGLESSSSEKDDGSGYEDAGSASSAPSSSDTDAASESSFGGGHRIKGKHRAPRDGSKIAISSTFGKAKELWREGVTAGLGPGKQVFIEKPKPRGDGGIKYSTHTIHPNTFAFLGDLRDNNDREWFKMHEPDFKASKTDWETFVGALSEQIQALDMTIPELPPKDIIFRIYRDVRFSNDKTPYKPHFSAAWSRTGRKGPYAAYYLQISPGHTFAGSGLWMPDASQLARLRRNVDEHPHEIKQVLKDADIRKEIFGGAKNDDGTVVQAFVAQNLENALKTKPKVRNRALRLVLV